MEALSHHIGSPTAHWEENMICIYVVKAKRVTPRVKHIDIQVYFLQEPFDSGLFIPKYDKSSFIPADMCTKPCSGPLIRRSTK